MNELYIKEKVHSRLLLSARLLLLSLLRLLPKVTGGLKGQNRPDGKNFGEATERCLHSHVIIEKKKKKKKTRMNLKSVSMVYSYAGGSHALLGINRITNKGRRLQSRS